MTDITSNEQKSLLYMQDSLACLHHYIGKDGFVSFAWNPVTDNTDSNRIRWSKGTQFVQIQTVTSHSQGVRYVSLTWASHQNHILPDSQSGMLKIKVGINCK